MASTNIPQYRIQLRDHTLTPVAELAPGALIDGDVVGNFNDVGAFALTVRADQSYSVPRNLYSAQQADVEMDASGFGSFVGAGGSIARDTTPGNAWHGIGSLKVITDGSATFQFVNAQLDASTYLVGASYTASFYIKGASVGGTLRWFVDSDSGAVSSVSTLTLSTTWTRYSVTFTAAAGKAWMGLRLDTGSPAQALTFYWDGLQIERGSSATDWAPGGALVEVSLASFFAPGYGVIISRDRGDGSGAQTLISGPIWHLERQLQANTYVLAGPDDLFWLKARRAEPVTVAGNYSAAVNAQPTLVRYYRLGEASGTTATDSKSGANGTYSATGVTYGVAPGIDDANTAVTLNGTSGWVSIPTTSLPTGNNPWCLAAWVKLSGTPAANAYIVGYGANTTGQNPLIYINTSRQVVATGFAWGDTTSATVLNVGDWHFIAATWDGTTLTGYLDGVSFGTHTPGVMTIPASGLSGAIGSNNAGTANFFPGSLDEVALRSGALSAASIAQLYASGISRYSQSAYDTRTNTASTVMRQYVDNNAGPSALLARRVTGLTLAADPALGSVVTGNERFDNLLAALQQLAISAGDIGFKLIQTDVGVLTFTIYQPATQSNAIFSQQLGNLLDATYTLDGPAGNQYVIGGGGEGTLRIFQTAQDSASVSAWGMVEGDFQDARDTSDLPTLQQRLAAQLAQDAQQTNLSITPVDTPALQYGRDYNLGDIVSVEIDGATITDKIRQIHIQLNSSDQELVTPGIGNAGAGQVAHLFDARARALATIQRQLKRLQAAQ